MMTTQAHNVLTGPTKTVYLNEPRNKAPDEEDKTEPQDSSENGLSTSATLTQEEETYKKRYDDANKYIRELKATYESKLAELELEKSQLTESKAIQAVPKTAEEFKEFQDKYPELAAHIITAATMVMKQSSSVVEQKLKQLETTTKAIDAEKGVLELKKYHPDFETIKDDARFHEWFNMQLPEIQALIKSPNPKVIARGLDLYKDYAGIKPPAQTKKDLTRDIKTPNRVKIGEGQKRTYTNAEIYKMSPKEFELNEADIVAAQYDGRIIG